MKKKPLHNNFYLLTAAFFMLCAICFPARSQAQSCNAKYSFSVSDLKVTFTDSSTAANHYRMLWSFGDGTSSDAKNPVKTYKSGGSYKVCLVIKDSVTHCMDTFCETVTVKAACESNWKYSVSGKTVTYTADTAHNKSTAKYLWRVETGVFKTGKTLSYTYAKEGLYEACLTVNDSPCISKICKLVTIGCHAKFTFKTDSLTASFTDLSSTSSGHFTRSWTFGDGKKADGKGPEHTYDSAGTYKVCLVIKDTISNCTDTFCETVVVKKSTCASNFTFSVSDKTVTLKADTTHHSATAKYVWRVESGVFKTGKHLSYTYTNDGKYEVCLTVVDSPCEAKTCKVVTIGTSTYKISGLIKAGHDTAFPGRVWLIVYKANDSVLKSVKETKIMRNSANTEFFYTFENVAPGTYYIKAALDTSSNAYSSYMPTYSDSALKWAKARKITVTTANLTGQHIYMVKGTNPGGKGFISGKISQGANKKEGDPISDIEIMLLNETGNPVAYTYSDLNGEFGFANIAFGTYQVYAEVAGLQTFPAIVSISESNQSNNDVNLKMNATAIVTAIRPAHIQDDNGISIYPNPVNNVLNINLDNAISQPVQIVVYSITGKQMINITKAPNGKSIQLPVNELTNGIYILEVKGQKSQTIMRTRFIKAF
ncbi:MAG: PKD domain-containing protein [Bacteroidia bacterium]